MVPRERARRLYHGALIIERKLAVPGHSLPYNGIGATDIKPSLPYLDGNIANLGKIYTRNQRLKESKAYNSSTYLLHNLTSGPIFTAQPYFIGRILQSN